MIVYQRTKEDFSNDVLTNTIDTIIAGQIRQKTGKEIGRSELDAFKNSLAYMDRVLHDKDIPENCGISVEYHIPQTCKRVDFIISGTDGKRENVIVIELKQWSEAWLTDQDGIIETRFRGGVTSTSHPSYQAWSYAALLQSFNATVEEEHINLQPCAYLHNYMPDDVITNGFYNYYIEKAPVFLKPDALELRAFIKRFMKYGDTTNIIARIDNGKIRPSKSLADSLKSIMKGNKEFIMIDDQKVVYEQALHLAKHSNPKNKNVLIVEGGPGTGKSVVAINLLVELNKRGQMTQYVTKTSAPREVYFDKLQDVRRMAELRNLFVGSGSFMRSPENAMAALIVDEAHRLTEKTGFLKQGDNQIREIINTAVFCVFFIDGDQRVHIDDYGTTDRIEQFALEAGARVHKTQLASQFRCNGSDGYLAWLDDVLQKRDTANDTLDAAGFDFEFKVLDSPSALRDLIFEKNTINNKARLVAGYCWDWKSKKVPLANDIVFPEYDFQMQWNLSTYGSKWIIDPNSVNEVGCIHTCQGLEVDYVGVIIGDDLICRNGVVMVNPAKRSKDDKSIFGYKKLMKENPEATQELLRAIIKNTYRVLMTRGMKGCYVYCTDPELRDYLKRRLGVPAIQEPIIEPGLLIAAEDRPKYKTKRDE
ncbi:DUF2075 domain-containing protein [Niabella soli]|uniref:ATP-binding protein n=1 Tax=Niabella soli DSM 19437 TaxID=929713 RepID=W0F0D2_9BACT|nr:DUF2075 domain-containing protein [Niabella soli]AHF16472.1 ATP-binding protein [Niabella soli DSM 19437]